MSNLAYSLTHLWPVLIVVASLFGCGLCMAWAMCRAASRPAPDAPYFRGADIHEPTPTEPWALPFNVIDDERAEYAAAALPADLAALTTTADLPDYLRPGGAK